MDKHIAESVKADLQSASKYVDYAVRGVSLEEQSQELVNQLVLLQAQLGDISNQISCMTNHKRKELTT